MDYLDTWVWIEYGLEGPNVNIAEDIIDGALDAGAVTSTITLLETAYILGREIDQSGADYVTSAIEDFESIHVIPVTAEIALYAAELRARYNRQERQLSYADAIHLATAVLTDCDRLQTGDADFEGVTEIEAIVHPDS